MKKNVVLAVLAVVVVALWMALDPGGEGNGARLAGEGSAVPGRSPEPLPTGELPSPPVDAAGDSRQAAAGSIPGRGAAPEPEAAAATPVELLLRGRVLAAESGRPIARAEVWFAWRVAPSGGAELIVASELPDAPDQVTGPEGRFTLACTPAEESRIVIRAAGRAPVLVIRATGRAPVLVTFGVPEAAAGNELEVRLSRSARLSGVVFDSRGVEAELDVRLETGTRWLRRSPSLSLSPGGLSWLGPVAADGRFTVEDLPPGVPLRATVLEAGEVVFADPTALTLEAGEEREVEWRVAAGTTLFGQVVDENELPLADRTIWLLPTAEARHESTRPSWSPTMRQVSDARGSFSFADVPPGEWTVGAAPGADAVTPCTRVTLAPGEAEAEVVVRSLKGEYIAGRVLDPVGDGAAKVDVTAHALGRSAVVAVRTGAEGRFRLGPLLPGEYRLQARRAGRGTLAPSERVVVFTGTEAVVLQLTSGGRVSGVVVDAGSGERVPSASVSIHSAEGEDYRMVVDREGGVFDFGGLEPGRYHLIGTTTDGRTGALRDLQIDAGTSLAELRIPARRGGTLGLRFKGSAEYATFSVEQDGVKYAFDVLHRETVRRVAVPHGELTVRLWGADGTGSRSAFRHEKRVEVDVGGELEVVFELEE